MCVTQPILGHIYKESEQLSGRAWPLKTRPPSTVSKSSLNTLLLVSTVARPWSYLNSLCPCSQEPKWPHC